MDTTVVALFDDMSTAEKAVHELENLGFSRDHISLMAANRGADDGGASTGSAADGAAAGAGIGAVLGGLAGLLVGIGALAIPGIGPIIAAGPLAAALGGAGIGAAAGGVIGALVDAGIPEEQAQYYAEGVRRGGTLVTVNASEGMADRATNVLNRYGPVDINQRAASWRQSGWSGFDEDAAEYRDTGHTSTTAEGYTGTGAGREGSTGYQETQHTGTGSGITGSGSGAVGSGAGYSGSGRHNEMAGRDVRDTAAGASAGSGATESDTSYGTGTGGMVSGGSGSGHYTDATTGMATSGSYDASRTGTGAGYGASHRSFNDDEDYFRQDYQRNYANSGYDYSYYQPGYRYGYGLSNNQQFQNRNWSDIQADVRRDWETQHPDNAWEDFKDSIRRGWERMKEGASNVTGGGTTGDEDYFRQDYNQNYQRSGRDYDQYRPAYRYGYDLAREDRFRNYEWSDVERDAQRDWQNRFPQNQWTDYRASVQYGWNQGRRGTRTGQSMQSMESGQSMGSGQQFDDAYFRQDWQRNYANRGYGYERYQPAYQYGYQLANDQRFKGRGWNDIESNVRRDWERQHPNDKWEDFKDAVRHGWDRIREGVRDTFDPDR
jgi:hypothetical protein